MKRRSQIEIAIEALKKQCDKYVDECQKARDAKEDAIKTEAFFTSEIKRLESQIKALEEPQP